MYTDYPTRHAQTHDVDITGYLNWIIAKTVLPFQPCKKYIGLPRSRKTPYIAFFFFFTQIWSMQLYVLKENFIALLAEQAVKSTQPLPFNDG